MGPEIDVAALSQLSSENLRVLLRKIPGSKDLIIHQSLMKPLDKFAAMSLIKSCGVERVFRLDKTPPGKKQPDTLTQWFSTGVPWKISRGTANIWTSRLFVSKF